MVAMILVDDELRFFLVVIKEVLRETKNTKETVTVTEAIGWESKHDRVLSNLVFMLLADLTSSCLDAKEASFLSTSVTPGSAYEDSRAGNE